MSVFDRARERRAREQQQDGPHGTTAIEAGRQRREREAQGQSFLEVVRADEARQRQQSAPTRSPTGGDRVNRGGIRGLIAGDTPAAPTPGPGANWEEHAAPGFRERQPGFAVAADLTQAAVSGVLRAGAETVDGLGAIGSTWRRYAYRNFGNNGAGMSAEEYDELLAERQRRVPRVNGQPLWNERDGDVMPAMPDLVRRPDNAAGQLTEGIVQFVTGYATLGRFLGPANNLSRTQTIGRALGQGAATDFFVWDGNEARLSNLLRDFANLRDPVTAYLAASEDDEEAEGRIKSVLEGAGLGLLFESLFAGLRALRTQRRVRTGAATEADLAEAARQAQAAVDADAARAAQAIREEARRARRSGIDADLQAELGRIANDPSTAPTSAEGAVIVGGDRSPTDLSPRQQGEIKRLEGERAAAEARAAERHRIEDMREAAENGNTADALRMLQEINNARKPQPGRAGPNPLRVVMARGGSEVKTIGREIVQDADGDVWNIAELTARVSNDGSVTLVHKGQRGAAQAAEGPRASRISQALPEDAPTSATESNPNAYQSSLYGIPEEAPAGKPQPQLEPSSHTVDIIPGSPLTPAHMVRVARNQASRMATAAESPATHAEGLAMRTESDRVSAIADELSDAIAHNGNVNEIAARLLAHLDDESTAALFPKRTAGAADAAIGQTDAQSFARAAGEAAPETPLVDEAFVRELAERYAASKDVASAAVKQAADAWRAGDAVTHSRDINLEHLQTEDQVKAFILSFTDLAEGAIRHIRGETGEAVEIGVRMDAQVQRTANALAKDAGSDSGTLMLRLAEITGSTTNLDAKVHALRMLQVTAADEAQRTMRVYLGSHSEADLNRALIALQAFSSVHATLKGASSEIARALRVMQNQVSPDRSLVEQFSQIVDEGLVRSLDPSGGSRNALDALQKLAGAVSHTNRRGVGRIFEPKWHRAVEDFYTASILSAPSTQVLNFIGNMATTLVAPVERMLGGVPRLLFKLDPAEVREGFDHAVGIIAATKEAFRFAARAFRENRTFLDSTFEADYKSNFRAEAFGVNPDRAFGQTLNGLGAVIGVVHRVMGAQDEFFKQLNYRAILYGNALREARAQGIKSPAGLRTFVNEFVAAGFDGNGHSIRAGVAPDQANLINNAYDRALRESRRNTFTEPIGQTLGSLERGLRAIPLGRLVIPFFRTPISIVKYAARRSGLSGRFYADVLGRNGKHVQRQAMGQVALGTIVYGTAIGFAVDGRLTGSGPSDPRVRQRLIEAGWQPYSIKVGERYYSYNRADPFGMFFGVVADMAQLANEEYAERPDDPVEVGALVIVNLAQMMRDKTFFQGIDTIFSAIENTDENRELENVEKLLGRYAGAVVPSFVSRASDDGYMRRPRSILDAVQARTPFRDGVELRRNWLGEPAYSPQPVMGHAFVSPLTSTPTGEDPVLEELARVAVRSRGGVSEIQRRMSGVDLTEFRSPVSGRNAFDRLQELTSETTINGQTLRERLTEYISSEAYQTRLTDGTVDGELETRGSRQQGIVRIRSAYLRQATRELRQEIPELDARLREAEALERSARRPTNSNTDRSAEGLPRGLEWLAGQ